MYCDWSSRTLALEDKAWRPSCLGAGRRGRREDRRLDLLDVGWCARLRGSDAYVGGADAWLTGDGSPSGHWLLNGQVIP